LLIQLRLAFAGQLHGGVNELTQLKNFNHTVE
jgi:hypothetical protein